jgi:CcmD family protein
MKKIIPFLVLLLTSLNLFAQEEVQMADQMRADGKIWVVVAVIAIVFIGIITYLVLLDRKINKIEKSLQSAVYGR